MKFIYLVAFLAVCTSSFSRDDQAWKSEKNIEKQYEVMKENLKFYGGYYLVTEEQFKEYHTSYSDTIKNLKLNIKQDQVNITTQANQIKKLTSDLKVTQENLGASLSREDSILSFWGETTKATFATVMYIIVFILAGVAAFLFLLFARSNKLTVSAQKDFDKLHDEYESHKKRALEREMKINRELQTERNKNTSRTK